MGSPLGRILADIFLGYVEKFLFSNSSTFPVKYFRFVDDTFCIFKDMSKVDDFFEMINSVHSHLSFTVELEQSGSISFLDVLITKSDNAFSNPVYRKPTWSGLYLHFFSFVPLSYKRNLVRNLFDRARRICSSDRLEAEQHFLKETLIMNGYPSSFIDKNSSERPPKEVEFGPEKKTAYLTVPFLGDRFASEVKRRVRAATALAFPAIEPKLLFTTRRVPVRPLKDPVPLSCASNLVYCFVCDCGDSYIGRTVRRLSKRVDEHLPAWTMTGTGRRPRSSARPTSAVTRHAVTCSSFDKSRSKLSFFTISRAEA